MIEAAACCGSFFIACARHGCALSGTRYTFALDKMLKVICNNKNKVLSLHINMENKESTRDEYSSR